MKPSTQATRKRLFSGAGVLALASFNLAPLHAQHPVLSAAGTRIGPHRMAVLAEASPSAPPQSTPTPPTPPDPNSFRDDLFAGTEKFAKNANSATEVNMDPDSLNLVNGPDRKRAHKMLLNVVHSYSYDKPGMYNPADVDEFRRKVQTGDWHCSIRTRDLKSGESTDICSRRRSPDLIETAIITVEPKELTFIHQIRRANGEGGSLGWEGLDSLGALGSVGMMPGLPLGVSMALLQPELRAESIASAALLRGQMAQFGPNLHMDMPRSLHPDIQVLNNFKFELTPEQKQQIQQLQKQLELHPPTP